MVIKKRRDNKLFRLLVVYTLIFSVGLNIALLCFFFFFLKQDRTYIQKSYPKKSSDFRPILVFKGSQIQDVSRYSFKQLKQSLSNKRLLEFGYTYREIALGFLNTHYHIDIQRVLGPSNLSFYPITFINKRGKKEDLLLLVGLSDVDYEKIATFMEKEKWPLTSKGQFLLLKEMKKQKRYHLSLVKTFYLTPEYGFIRRLLKRSLTSLSNEAVLKLVLEGSWSLLEKVYKAKQNPDYLSKQGAILCLEAYLSQGSTQALPYLIKLDMNYIVKRLDNNSLTHLLKGPRDTYLKPLAKAVLLSPRKLLVRRQAAYWLYKFYSKPIPEPFDLQTSIKELIYQSSIGSPIIVSSKRLTQYQVKKGDTLWRIAKYFQLDMDQLKAHNPEINKMLIPGSFIQIPNREVDPLLQDSTDDT